MLDKNNSDGGGSASQKYGVNTFFSFLLGGWDCKYRFIMFKFVLTHNVIPFREPRKMSHTGVYLNKFNYPYVPSVPKFALQINLLPQISFILLKQFIQH